MRQIKRLAVVAMSLGMALGMLGIVYGASKKITSVTLRIESDITIGSAIDADEIEVKNSSSKYTVEGWEIQNEGFEWDVTDVPQIKVTLDAKDGYYFSLAASDVKLTGASYVKGVKENSATTLVLTMNLPALNTQVAEVENITLSTDGTLTWDAAPGAGSYEVKVLRNDSVVGSAITTTSTSCSVSDLLVREGSYYARVRAMNSINPSTRSKLAISNSIYVGAEQAEQFRANSSTASGWVKDNKGWWYRNLDGSYTTNNWHKINDVWYYFGSDGYMMTGWVQVDGEWYYCDPVSGAMWANTTTPDGYQLGADGAMVK